ncbi:MULTISPECIES: hypothetical protein [unclassified Micromonospora]|uniref:hypothetical protein n=1 Tax=unclassified Micromonospora TaxID=2617518 RepID=UPI001B39C001|nr:MULTISPECIES: hypothetical protein [unclassified Micromonospora]MBQ1042075.1 hypothetical protein [Micromonospora sp. C72]MBQ1054319.1 hypothetical protein [Micromonospora sp. C32]
MPLVAKPQWIAWLLGPSAVAAALLAQFAIATRTGLLPFDQSFAAGLDGEWLTLSATVAGLAAVTSALGGIVASGLVAGSRARLGIVVLVAVAGLTSLPFLRGSAREARDVILAVGGPENSVTVALVVGLGLGALTAGAIISAGDWRPAAAGLAVTTAALWVLVAISGKTSAGLAPLGLPGDLLRAVNGSGPGWWLPLPAVLWVVIGGASALAARSFTTSRVSLLLSGVLGAVLVCLSYFAAWPGEPYVDHLTVHTSAFSLTRMLVGGALLGTGIVSLAAVRTNDRAQTT